MKIIITETKPAELTLIDPATGDDYVTDFLVNAGALIDGEWNEDAQAYICNKLTYEVWSDAVARTERLARCIYIMSLRHGVDAVTQVVSAAINDGGENQPAKVIEQALENAFGQTGRARLPRMAAQWSTK